MAHKVINKKVQEKITRKVNRELELEVGRVSYGRIHKSIKSYNRKKEKFSWEKFINQ